MPEPTPTPAHTQTLAQQIAAEILAGESGKPKRPLEEFSSETLRILHRAGLITLEEWNAELVARGKSQTAASVEIGNQLQTNVNNDGTLSKTERDKVVEQQRRFPNGLAPAPAPVANAAASATAGGQAGGNAQFEGGGAERATGAATGAFGGTAQPSGAQALSAPQQGGGGAEPAKPKPIRWSTSLNAWVRDTGRKDASGGNIVEIVDGPPSPEGSVAGGKRGDQRLVWDAVAKAYRQVEWDSGDQEWVWTDKLQNLPPIQRTAGGEALTTGRDVATGRAAT